MTNLREKFTANAEEFDSLMMEMLNENSQLSSELQSAAQKIADRLPSEIAPSEVTWPAILSAVSMLKQQRNNADVENEALTAQVAELKDLLVCITHHEGAVEEYRARWEPVVRKELSDRLESN